MQLFQRNEARTEHWVSRQLKIFQYMDLAGVLERQIPLYKLWTVDQYVPLRLRRIVTYENPLAIISGNRFVMIPPFS